MENIFCIECGSELSTTAKFCESCGIAIGDTKPKDSVTTKSKKKSGNALQNIIIIVGVLVGLVVIIDQCVPDVEESNTSDQKFHANLQNHTTPKSTPKVDTPKPAIPHEYTKPIKESIVGSFSGARPDTSLSVTTAEFRIPYDKVRIELSGASGKACLEVSDTSQKDGYSNLGVLGTNRCIVNDGERMKKSPVISVKKDLMYQIGLIPNGYWKVNIFGID
mgnify:CR=1 FL=1|tara:strand:- start:231 stop:890 length:660 start_codon:yes stop_codon:yes gene_type:complete